MSDRLPMPSWMDATVAERLSDVADHPPAFNYYEREDIAAVVPADLVDAVQAILECRGSTVEAYENARLKLEIALGRRFMEI